MTGKDDSKPKYGSAPIATSYADVAKTHEGFTDYQRNLGAGWLIGAADGIRDLSASDLKHISPKHAAGIVQAERNGILRVIQMTLKISEDDARIILPQTEYFLRYDPNGRRRLLDGHEYNATTTSGEMTQGLRQFASLIPGWTTSSTATASPDVTRKILEDGYGALSKWGYGPSIPVKDMTPDQLQNALGEVLNNTGGLEDRLEGAQFITKTAEDNKKKKK
jgi:hypothetical protein